jgi:hypothetical protein
MSYSDELLGSYSNRGKLPDRDRIAIVDRMRNRDKSWAEIEIALAEAERQYQELIEFSVDKAREVVR